MMRIFYASQRSFHHAATQYQYTRTALRRLKKSDLVALADQHQLDVSGTKNELIDRLVTSSSFSTLQSNTTDPSSHISDKDKVNEDEGYDRQWVEAFDLKVSNRTSARRQPSQNSPIMSSPSESSSTHPAYVHQSLGGSSTTSTPVRPTITTLLPTDNNKNDSVDMDFTDPEINQQWVKAFDQRVKSSRTKRREILDPIVEQQQQQQQQPPSSNIVVDKAIGISLVLWYFLGEHGIQSTFSSLFSS
ncbi:uncharacterized protein BX664DRAFT_325092 [Halteromyces radiatus]|uniref:uncharacterized protein n=1 Tax=Halteromyces radiatus TaxID=101107 RepID=UPI002220FAD1|nr:uncharacterized protein BX664DRAFT_325092 [Halteromyces radiatus]KAI8096875.1 hypothetical protein BX664DRAFT_325092 [Halteromyces radiatus]